MMRKIIYLAFLLLSLQVAQAQIGMGTRTPNSNAILDLSSSKKALLLPRVTSALSITTPTDGMVIFDVSAKCTKSYENGVWSKCLTFEPPQLSHTVSVSGLLNTVNGGASSAVIYETAPLVLKIDLAPGRQLASVTTASTGATVSIVDKSNGLVLVRAGSSNVVLNATDQVLPFLNGMQRVDITSTSLTLTTSNQNYSLGTTLQDGDILEVEHQFDGVATERQILWVKVKAGTTQRAIPWVNGIGGYITSLTFPSTLTNVVQILAATTTATPVVLSMRVWRNGTNVFVVPSGTVAINRCKVTANAGAVTVNGQLAFTALQGLSYQFQLGLAAGRRLLTCKVGGVDVAIANALTGTVNYTPTTNTVNFQITDAPVPTYSGRQTIGRYTIANPSDINGTTITTNIDMRTAKYLGITYIDFSASPFDGATGVRTWQTSQLDLEHLRNNNGLAYMQIYNDAYIELHVQDFATGRIYFVDNVRNMQVKEIFVEDDALNGFIIPSATTVSSAVIVTCNSGSVNINNSASTTLFSGKSSRVMITTPAGQMISSATANNGVGVSIVDAYTGALEVTIVDGAAISTANITVNFVPTPSGIVKLTPAAGGVAVAFDRTNSSPQCFVNFVATRTGLWDIDSNLMGWDLENTPDVPVVVEILQGTTVLDTFQHGIASSHMSGNFMDMGQASNQAYLVAGTTYTIRLTSTGLSNRLNGLGIQSVVMRLAQAGDAVSPIGVTTKTPVTATLSSQSWAHTSTTTATVLEGTGPYVFQIVAPLNQVLSSVTSSPANLVTIVDAASNLVSVNVPAGTGNITVTPTFVSTVQKINFKTVASLQFDANFWATRSFGTVGNGLTGPDVNSFYTATRDMDLSLVATMDATDGINITVGLLWQANGGSYWQDFNPDGQTQNTPNGNYRYTESKRIFLKANDQIRLQNFVGSFSGARNVRIAITEM